MPISKRLLYTATAHAPPSLLTNSTEDSALGDVGIARAIGAMQQLNNLAMYAAEIFDNISLLSEDTCGRLKELTVRTSNVMKALPVVEARVFDTTIAVTESDLMKASNSSRKASSIPTVLTKRTNCQQINSQYDKCSLPPQLWKLESVIPEDCMINYSDPGFFFKEWLKQEQERQEADRRERKKTKELKRTAKLERRKQRRALKGGSADNPDNRKSLRRTVSLPTKPTPRGSVVTVPTNAAGTGMNSSNIPSHKSAARTLFNTPMGTNSPPMALKRQSTIGTLQPSSALRKGMPPLLSSQTPNSASLIAYRTPTMRLFSMEEEMRQEGVDPHARLVPAEALTLGTAELRDDLTPTPPPVEELSGTTSRQPFSSLPQSHSSLDGLAPPSRKKSILMRSATTVETSSSRYPNRRSMVGGALMSPPDDAMVTPENRRRRSIIQASSFSKGASGLTATKAPVQVMMRSSISFRKTAGEDVAYLGLGVPGTKPPMHPRGSVSGPLGTNTMAVSAVRSRNYEAGPANKENNGDDEIQSFDSRQGIKSTNGGGANSKLKTGVPSFMTHYSTFDMTPPALDPTASKMIFGVEKFKLDLDDAWYRAGAEHQAEQPGSVIEASGASNNDRWAGQEGSERGSTNRSVSSSASQKSPPAGIPNGNTSAAGKSKPSKPSAPPTLGFGSVLDFLPPYLAYLKDFKDENEFYESNVGFSTVGGDRSAEGEDDLLPPPPGDEDLMEAPGYNEYSEYEQQGEVASAEAEQFIDELGNESYYDPEGRPYYLASDGNYYYYEEEAAGDPGWMHEDALYQQQHDMSYYQDEDTQRQRMGMLDAIRNAGPAHLRQVVPIERRVDVRQQLMENIRGAAVALRPTTVNVKTNIEQKHEAIAAILSNRSKIAGSDSDSDTSDSDFSDDDYF